jgi:hypothetical protein
MTFKAIATAPPGFLVITFKRFWNIVVYYKTNIGFVDTHAKSNGGADDINFFIQEVVLIFHAHIGIEAGMIRSCLKTINV